MDLGLDEGHLSDDAIHCHELVDHICLEASGRDVVATEIPLEVHPVYWQFAREISIQRLGRLLAPLLATVLSHCPQTRVQLVLKHLDCLDGVFEYEVG